jgi:hypothetical protein
MTPYTDAELQAMLADLESDRVERKESFRGQAPTTVREAVCAFANDLAEALRALGYVQRFGAGIAIARRALGARLRFEVQPGHVAAIAAREAA